MKTAFMLRPSHPTMVLCQGCLILRWPCSYLKKTYVKKMFWFYQNGSLTDMIPKNTLVQERFWEWFLRRSKNNRHNFFNLENPRKPLGIFIFQRILKDDFHKKVCGQNVLSKRFWERSLSTTFEKFQDWKIGFAVLTFFLSLLKCLSLLKSS